MSTNEPTNKRNYGKFAKNIIDIAMDKRKKLIGDIDSDKMPGFYYNKKHDIFYSSKNDLKNNGYKQTIEM